MACAHRSPEEKPHGGLPQEGKTRSKDDPRLIRDRGSFRCRILGYGYISFTQRSETPFPAGNGASPATIPPDE